MMRKKILWLVSWYPNKNDRFDGDFIQRHARAAAINHDIHLVFVTDTDSEKSKDEEWNYATGLTEQIIYFKKRRGFIGRLSKQLVWRNLFQEAVTNYISKNGLPDCIHVHVPWKAGLIALWMKKKYRKDFIVTEHWGIYHDDPAGNFFVNSKLAQKLLKKIYKSSKAFVTVSRFLANAVRSVAGVNNAFIIPNVVDTTLFFPKEEKYSKFTFIHVSNMTKVKNVDSILEVFKNLIATHPQVQLIMIGNRDENYVRLAEGLGVLNNSVFFRGEISYVDVAEEMRRSHSLVLFSDSETFSCVTAEALCCGLPVIASNVGALSELVNEKNGILVAADDKNALLNAMQEIMDKYNSFDNKLISEEASKKFRYPAVSQKFDELYREVC
jgi:glycosyltransferase involved in cell wall biosynthesis